MDGLSYTAVTPRASLQSDANNSKYANSIIWPKVRWYLDKTNPFPNQTARDLQQRCLLQNGWLRLSSIHGVNFGYLPSFSAFTRAPLKNFGYPPSQFQLSTFTQALSISNPPSLFHSQLLLRHSQICSRCWAEADLLPLLWINQHGFNELRKKKKWSSTWHGWLMELT